MKFKFTLEAVLKERKRQLDVSQQIYFEAQAKVDNHLSQIKNLYNTIDASRQKISMFQKSNMNQGQSIELFENMIEGQRQKIKTLRVEVRELMRIAEEKRELMVEKSKEHKAIEKLKEKRREDFVKKKKLHEAKRIDEVASQRFKRSAM